MHTATRQKMTCPYFNRACIFKSSMCSNAKGLKATMIDNAQTTLSTLQTDFFGH